MYLYFQTCKAFLPAMIKANHGHLVCISSAAGVIGINGLSGEYFTYYSVHRTRKLGLFQSIKPLPKPRENLWYIWLYF